jgi:hypothetical protein
LGRPQRRRHGRDPQLHVNVGPRGVVDTRHHVLYFVVVAGDARAQDVRVVAARHRGQSVRPAGVGLKEDVAIETGADEGFPIEPGQALKGLAIFVNDDDGIAFFRELHSQF